MLPPVTFVQIAFATPVPRPVPRQTLPSFVPATATLGSLTAWLNWLMKERSPSVPFVRFGLFAYHDDVGMPPRMLSHTRFVPAIMRVQPVAVVQPLPGASSTP